MLQFKKNRTIKLFEEHKGEKSTFRMYLTLWPWFELDDDPYADPLLCDLYEV
jgi:hypothetical protein